MNAESSSKSFKTFSRCPVFDAKKKLWAYEMVQMTTPGMEMDSGLLSGLAASLDQTVGRGRKIIIRFHPGQVIGDLPHILPPGRTVIRISDPAACPETADDLLRAMAALKKTGYRTLLDWHENHSGARSAVAHADIVAVNMDTAVLPDMHQFFADTGSSRQMRLAEGVNGPDRFDRCARAGFDCFTGTFFKQPENVTVGQMVPGTISKFKLMEAIERPDPDFSDLAAVIQADVSVSFRLLSYLNSAHFAFKQKIDSIRDAITLLGWQNMKTWLRISILAEVSENRHASELIFLSAWRGKFLSQIVRDHAFWGFDPDVMGMLGTFSLLDALMNRPMTEITRYLPLSDKLKGALRCESNNEYVPLLRLAERFEDADFSGCGEMILRLGLDRERVNRAYYAAMDFADALKNQT